MQIQLSLMNNESKKNFEDTKGFILDTPKDMKLDFFGVDFWHLLCLSSIETSFAPLRIDRHSPSFPLFLLLHNLPQSFLGWPSIYGFSCSPFLNHWAFILSLSFIIDSISVFILPNNISLIAPSVGCDPSQVFFLKENILPGSKLDCKG